MLFTIPSPMLRAANNTVSISIVELLALSKVSSNPQFADKVNWEKVTVCWKSTVGGQREYLSFAFAGASSSQSFYVSDNSRIDWVLSYVAITNIDKETLILSRADIPTVGMYDFSFEVAPEPSGAEYRYIRMEVYQSWADNTQTGTSGIVSIAEFKLKIDDVIETLTSYPKISFNAAPNSVLGGDSFSYFVDGLDTPDSNLTFWTLNGVDFALFQIDIGAGKTVSEVLIAPQLAGSTSANMPKSFKIFGSNDNVAFTEILNVNETTLSEAGSWIAARYKVFPIV